MFVLEKYWWTLVSSWPDELEKVGQPEKNILKRKYENHRQIIKFCIQLMIILTFILFKCV